MADRRCTIQSTMSVEQESQSLTLDRALSLTLALPFLHSLQAFWVTLRRCVGSLLIGTSTSEVARLTTSDGIGLSVNRILSGDIVW